MPKRTNFQEQHIISEMYKQRGIRIMDRCSPKKASLEKSVSDSQLFQKKENPNHSWLTRSSNALEKESTDFSEYKDEAGTSHGKDTKHESSQWVIDLKDANPTNHIQEVKELVSKINETLHKLREDVKMSNFSQEVLQRKIDNIVSDIYKCFESKKDKRRLLMKSLNHYLAKKDKRRSLMKSLNHYLGLIQDMTKVVSNLKTGPNIIREALTTGKFPEALKKIIRIYINTKIMNIRFLDKRAKWEQWAQPSNDIAQIKTLLNLLNDKQKNLEKPFKTENFPAGLQENKEPHHLKVWRKKLQKKKYLWKQFVDILSHE